MVQPVEATTPQTEQPEAVEIVTEASARAKLDQYMAENNITGAIKIILSKPIKVNDALIELTITNSVEIAMIQNIEVELLGFLRTELKNNTLAFNYQITEDKEERRPYTSAEIFKAMAKKNPALIKLADEFGLDTEY